MAHNSHMHYDVKSLAVYGQKAVGSKFYYDVKNSNTHFCMTAMQSYSNQRLGLRYQTDLPDKSGRKRKRKAKINNNCATRQRVQPVSGVFAARSGRPHFHANETICSHRKK